MFMTEKENLINFEKKIAYFFTKPEYLKVALTHKSYAYEKNQTSPEKYNERIEYLGDAILEHYISELLFRHIPKYTEGQMTRKRANIVCEKTLSAAMQNINAQENIYVGKCESSVEGGINDAILCDLFEAVIGAIYIDGGYEESKKVCLKLLDKYIKAELEGKELVKDYKTKLQEKLQVNGNVKIEYILRSGQGPDHDKTFVMDVLFNGKKIGEGVGKSKKQAEQQAAKYALDNGLKNIQ